MDVNFNFYDLDIADIWKFEQELFLGGKSTNDLAKKIIDKVEQLIIRVGSESFTSDLIDKSIEDRSYYVRNIEDYRIASKTLKNRFEINYFFNNGSCYEFDQHIVIKRDNPDFEFWFALKLRQYDSKLTEVNNFFESQLRYNFNNDSNDFFDFLKVELRQYQHTIFSDRIFDTVDLWIKENNSKNRKLRGKYASLRIRELDSDPNYFQKNTKKLNDIFKQLKDHDFVHVDTLFTDFKRIFEGSNIPESKRIVWTGTNKDLQWFMKYLSKDLNKIKYHKDDIWVIANKCFVNKEGKEFGINPLRKANGKNLERKKLLETILDRI